MTDRELDALVAEKVMGYCVWPGVVHGGEDPVGSCGTIGNRGGWAACDCPCGKRRWFGMDDDPHYSTEIAAAWTVAEKVPFRLELTEYDPEDGPRWMAKFMGPGYVEAKAEDDSAPRAICLAALKAVGVEVK